MNVDLGIAVSMVLFYLSFAWLFAERTNNYPYLRRLSIILAGKKPQGIKSPHVRVMLWGFGYTLLWIIISAISFYMYHTFVDGHHILSILIGPVLYFLAPQAISPSMTLLIVWKVPDDPKIDKSKALGVSISTYRSEKKARNLFIAGFFSSLLLTYGTPVILWWLN